MEEHARSRERRRSRSGTVGALQIVVTVLALWSSWAGAVTDPSEVAALGAIKASLTDTTGVLANWQQGDPCDVPWFGIFCEQDSSLQNHVVEIRLLRNGLAGTLAPEVGNLKLLRSLNLEWNNITGQLPASVGNLSSLELLLVSGNKMEGLLPPEIGNLGQLNRLQIDQNNFSGAIPVDFGKLDLVQHLHMNNNSLSGEIPAVLGQLRSVVHILLDNNNLDGTLPPELANSPTLQILQLDNNPFLAQPLPPSYGTFRSPLLKLSMRNCNLNGSLPDLSGLRSLQYLDLSFNRLTGPLTAFSAAPNVTTLIMSDNQLAENITGLSIGNLPNLQVLLLSNNSLSGQVDAAVLVGPTTAIPPRVIDFQDNELDSFLQAPDNVTLWLANNGKICVGQVSQASECKLQSESVLQLEAVHQDDEPVPESCAPCSDPDQSPKNIQGRCFCLYAITVGFRLKSPSFAIFGPYRTRFLASIAQGITSVSQGNVTIIPDQVQVNSTWEPGPRLRMNITLFPNPQSGPNNSTVAFTDSQVAIIYDQFANWKLPDNLIFGPQEFLSWNPSRFYDRNEGGGGSKTGLSTGAVVGIVLAAVAVSTILVAIVGILYFRRRTEKLLKWRPTRRHVGFDEEKLRAEMRSKMKVTGVREFMYEEVARATDNFSDVRQIGEGGYGPVYKGEVEPSGEIVAIKRAGEGSLQGSTEFYTEIELLSRVHHRNLLRLVGYCDDEGEQMLVYEFMEGGTLREHLSVKDGGVPLDLAQRLRIAMGSARGIAYLHNEASPPIFHRDIKTSNVLLDARGNAKVADFGLSKLAPAPELEGIAPGHVSTVVKGTPGYLDPEYFLTHKLTDKSDVYSFGVVLLEIITGLYPISNGRNIVREVTAAVNRGELLSVVDSRLGWYPSEAATRLIRLALACCSDGPDLRPTILEVVRELEDTWRATPWGGGDTDRESYVSGSDTHSNVGSLPNSTAFSDSQPNSGYQNSGLVSGTVHRVQPR